MSETANNETAFAKHITDLTQLIAHHRSELSWQLDHHDFERAKDTATTLQSLLEILSRLHSIEHNWASLHGQPLPAITAVPAVVKIPGKRGRPRKNPLVQPVPVAATLPGEPKRRGRKPGSKNKPKDGVPPKEPKERIETRGRKRKASDLPHLNQKDYYRPILEVLHDNNGAMEYTHCRDVVRSRMSKLFQAGDFEPVGDTDIERWAYLIPWARIRLVKAGLMKKDSARKMWEISNLGLDWLEGKLDITPAQIDKLELPWLLEETPEEKLLRLRALMPQGE